MKKALSLLLLLFAAAACRGVDGPVPETFLVLEGWIDSGGHPTVLLSETMPVRDGAIGQEEMISSIAKWAKVTVSDGEQEVVLTGRLDTRYFPPYVFSTSKITGVPGKTYSVRAEYKDYVATAQTTIPEPVRLEAAEPRVMRDSIYTIVCRFLDPAPKGNYYKVFTMTVGQDSRYQPSTLAMASDEVFDGMSEIVLWNTQRLMTPLYFPNIRLGDEVWVKFCTTDRQTFDFWQNYEVTLATNANAMYFFDSDVSSNVKGALGYWAGYGVYEYKVKVE